MVDLLPIKIIVGWIEEAGNGSRCTLCGDVCWLRHLRLVVDVNGEATATKIAVCKKCCDERSRSNAVQSQIPVR